MKEAKDALYARKSSFVMNRRNAIETKVIQLEKNNMELQRRSQGLPLKSNDIL